MVKRISAFVFGGVAAAALWYGVLWAHKQLHESQVISVDGCAPDALIDCVTYHEPAVETVVEPCKAWLANENAGVAILSQCLHRARPARDSGEAEIASSA